ncbi:MAG: glycosyltransferase family 2 protein [Acidimicrobiia bacterium]
MQQPPAPIATVVVPTRNSARTMAACLRSIIGQTDRHGQRLGVELIVVDNHSDDGTASIAADLAHRVVIAGPERSAQRNAGAALASSAVIAFIDSDQLLQPTVVAEAVALLEARPEVGVVVVPERSFGQGWWAAARCFERRLSDGDARTEAGRFYRRDALELHGGFDETLTGPEDWELHDRMVAAGWQVARTTARIEHDEGRIDLRAAFAKKRYYGRAFHRYQRLPWARRGAFAPSRLATRPTALLRRPDLTARLVVLKAVEAAGAACGTLDARRARRSQRPRPLVRTNPPTRPTALHRGDPAGIQLEEAS